MRPNLDEKDILRAEGPLGKLKEYFNNRPIILSSKHPFVVALIKEYHTKYYHCNSETVMNELRQKFFILGVRKKLRSIMNDCVICKKQKGKPKNPLMGSLPERRSAYKLRAFSHCGIDYFGPMVVKIGRREKRWGVLFTCMTTRAIHLEFSDNLTSSAVIMAIQRLAAKIGCPKVMYSGNGTNFRGTCKELKNELDTMDANGPREFGLRNGMRWIFNPPDAPHMEGAWERLVRSVKVALRVILRDEVISPEVLYTLC
ncbi:uncharacterized protein [Prorops nasuta]|uniref:uncharacterized protein n=1 Tax=Prorops nasuta TaxID=863751 RepID=UPI0034CE1612